MLIEQAMEFCPYLGIEVGRINENGKTILTKRVGDSERLHTNEEFTKYITERLSQSEDVMGRVRNFLSQNTIQWYEAWDNELQIREAMGIYGMTLKDMGVE